MSAVLNATPSTTGDVSTRLAFQKNLQVVTNRIPRHQQHRRDHVGGQRGHLQPLQRRPPHDLRGRRGQSTIISKVKTGLNSFATFKLPIAEHSIAGFVAFSQKLLNLKDVYDQDEPEEPQRQPALPAGSRQAHGYRTKQKCSCRRSWRRSRAKLIGVAQLINSKSGSPFGSLAEEGMQELCQTLAIAFKQRQKPQVLRPVRLPRRRRRDLRRGFSSPGTAPPGSADTSICFVR